MLNQKELADYVCEVGMAKVTKGDQKVFISGILAGLFIGLGYFGYLSIIESGVNGASLFYGALIFSVGLVMILIAGGDLFTGNCLVTMGCFNKKYKFRLVAKNLGLVYLGNFVGALFLVALIYFGGMGKNVEWGVLKIAITKTDATFIELLLRGILCNILVAMAVYISYASKNIAGKILAAILPVMLFVVSAFEHSVANMFVLFLGKTMGADISIFDILIGNLLPVTIGNIIGGGIIVPGAYFKIFLKDA